MYKKLQYKKNVTHFFVFVLLFTFSLNFVSASSLFDIIKQKEISFNIKNKSIKYFLQEIQKQSDINFAYNDDIVPLMPNMSLNVKNESVESVLKKLFNSTPLTYHIENNVISIVKKETVNIPQNDTLQQKKITINGQIIDNSTKEPVIGATVIIENTQKGVITDADGKFSIQVSENDVLEISFLGMVTVKRAIKASDTNIIIEMQQDAVAVDEVVVTGMFNKSVESFTGSAVKVTAKELEQFGNRNVLETLRNIDPSFNIVENNALGSDPNNLPEINIRGTSSMPNIDENGNILESTRTSLNAPLIIIDGFTSNLTILLDMNDSEIESITILKDASATAMYGSRGANGVLIVETKDPISGRLRVNIQSGFNFELPDLTSYSLLNARQKLHLETQVGKYDSDQPQIDLLLKGQYNYLLAEINRGVDTYWLSKPLRSGVGQRHSVRLDGGDKAFRYSATVQYNNIEGAMKQSSRENLNGNLNISYRHKNVLFSNNVIVNINNQEESPYGSFQEYADMNPYFSPYDSNGNIVQALGVEGIGAFDRWGEAGVANPLWNATLNTYSKQSNFTFTNNTALEWTIVDDLVLRGRLGVSKTVGDKDKFYPSEHTKFRNFTIDDILRRGEYSAENSKGNSFDANVNLTYSKIFKDKHILYTGVNYNIRQTNEIGRGMIAEGFNNQDLDFIALALQYKKDTKPSGYESQNRAVGLVGNLNYSYDNRYYADFTLTGDGNSAFGSNNRFGLFWSGGLGWNIHSEKFLKDNKVLTKLKARGSVGSTGNQGFNSYQALTTYRYLTDSRYFSWIGSDVFKLGNPDLKWQQTLNYNLGLEADFFSRRVSFTFDTYLSITKNQVSSINIPTSTGFAFYIDNIGSIENRGFELNISGMPIRNLRKEIIWTVSGSIVYNKNKIIELSQSLKDAQRAAELDGSSNPNIIYREGRSMNDIYVVPSYGIDPSTGKEQFVGANGEPTFEWDARNLAPVGINIPKYRGNLNSSLRYKDLIVSVAFGYNFGGQLYNQTLIDKIENVDYDNNVDSRVLTDRWQKPGDNVSLKSIHIQTRTQKTSRFVQNENTLRLNNISAIYELKNDFVKENLKLERLTVQVSMSDLFYLSSVKRERGTEYPFSRRLSLSLNLTF